MSEDKTTPPVAEAPSPEKSEAAETAPKTTTKRKKDKRSVPVGQVHIKATFNNTIITVTDMKGNALSWSSAGSCGFRGSKKGTAYAAQIASEKALTIAKNNHGLKKADVYVGGIGLGRESAIRALQNADIDVEKIKDVTTVAHGGVRPPGQRRT